MVPKFSFMPKEESFFDFFEASAQNMVKIAHELKELVDNWKNVEGEVAQIMESEHRGDSITHEIIARVNRTFVTPFDREDIALLAHSMDDVTDFIDAAADAMLIYKVERPSHRAMELADIIVQQVSEIERAIPRLRNRAEFKDLLKQCVEINRLENIADRIFRSAMAELFNDTSNIAQVIKWREILQHMENATDRGEDVANVLEGVVLKHG